MAALVIPSASEWVVVAESWGGYVLLDMERETYWMTALPWWVLAQEIYYWPTG